MDPVYRLNLIGCGRVGLTLAGLWQQAALVKVAGLYARHPVGTETARQFLDAGLPCSQPEDLPPADLWLITTPDTAIAEAASRIARRTHTQGDHPPVALHCSGFHTSEVLAPLVQLGWRVASAHPVRSFAGPDTTPGLLSGTPVALEGQAHACDVARHLFGALGAQCFDISAESKPLYHAAAVFANNFTTVLHGVARQLWQHCGITPDMARQLDLSLLASTQHNLQTRSPDEALTGPAARGDTVVVRQQGASVAHWNPTAGEAYRLLSAMAHEMKTTGKPLD